MCFPNYLNLVVESMCVCVRVCVCLFLAYLGKVKNHTSCPEKLKY